jgi:hypothetical protein
MVGFGGFLQETATVGADFLSCFMRKLYRVSELPGKIIVIRVIPNGIG